jgi:hypothetical protein
MHLRYAQGEPLVAHLTRRAPACGAVLVGRRLKEQAVTSKAAHRSAFVAAWLVDSRDSDRNSVDPEPRLVRWSVGSGVATRRSLSLHDHRADQTWGLRSRVG